MHHHFLCKAIYNQRHRSFCVYAPLIAIENLVFTDFLCCCFVFDDTCFILYFYVRKRVSTAFIAKK